VNSKNRDMDAPIPSSWSSDDGSADANGSGRRDAIAVAHRALEPVQASLTAAGYCAYGTLDGQHRWAIAADDEAGRSWIRRTNKRETRNFMRVSRTVPHATDYW
jgi:hypothetical protein